MQTPVGAGTKSMEDDRIKSEQEVEIEGKWRDKLLHTATAQDFQQAYDELHSLFLKEQGGPSQGSGRGHAQVYDTVNPRGMDRARRVILHKIGQGRDVLEVGCGDGETSRLLARQGNRVVSIDISSVALETARSLAAPSAALRGRCAAGESLDLVYRH
ncbi:MAG: methyltransferase domain-containing protein, partial [Chloroflexi bacterium]|nr:methyltransferase domain-containing protein [Chloroflexota bacterium]